MICLSGAERILRIGSIVLEPIHCKQANSQILPLCNISTDSVGDNFGINGKGDISSNTFKREILVYISII